MIALTSIAYLAAKQSTLNPQMVLSVDGLSTKFGVVSIYEQIHIGDPGLFVDNYLGDSWFIGGLRLVPDQGPWISLGNGTSTKYQVQLQPDKGLGASVGQFSINLIDKNEAMSKIISPGFVIDDLLSKFCKIQIGFQDTAYPQDYITVFRGYIESNVSGAGNVTLLISSVDQKIRQQIYVPQSTTTTIDVAPTNTLLSIADVTSLSLGITGPNGSPDSSYEQYVLVESEAMKVSAISSLDLTVARGTLETIADNHASGATVNPFYRLTGNGLDLARKLMLSGWNGYWKTGVTFSNFNRISPTELVPNAIFFYNVDVSEEYGLYKGEYITTSGASNGANNVTLKQIQDIVQTNDGSYIVVSGVSFVEELSTGATISFRSKWDTLPFGLGMTPQEVDLLEFDNLYTTFLSSFDFDFRITEGFDAKDFIDMQLFRPMSAYSIPRKGRASVGYHTGPLPGADILTLSDKNVENADKLKIGRSLTKNFINQVIYDYEYDVVAGQTSKTKTNEDDTSINDFSIGISSQSISAEGMRSSTFAESRMVSASNRLLKRYSRGAEFIDGIEVRFGDAFNREIGDIVLIDMAALKMTDKTTGNREGTTRLFQIQNKSMDIKTGKITLNVVDTNFSTAARYSLIAPASQVQNGISTTKFNIKPSYGMTFGSNEYLKWTRFLPCSLRVRSPDGVTRNAVVPILSISGNTISTASSLGFVPQANDIMEFPHYDQATSAMRAAYCFMRNTDPFSDGKNRYQMI